MEQSGRCSADSPRPMDPFGDDGCPDLFYLFLDLLLLFFFALLPDLFFEGSLPVFSFKETCSRLPLLACPFANCLAISAEVATDPFWLYWPVTEWFFPDVSLLPLPLPLLAVVPCELTRLQLSSLPLLPICDSDSLYRSTGIKFTMGKPRIGTRPAESIESSE